MTNYLKKIKTINHNLPVVAILGRPNVGKSSLFNVLLGERKAIVHSEAGVTRDRITAYLNIKDDVAVQLVDTGGISLFFDENPHISPTYDSSPQWEKLIREHVEIAVNDADLLIFVTDIREGVLPLDESIADKIRISGKPCIIAVNKVDNPDMELNLVDFHTFGFPDVMPISCAHKRNISRLLEKIAENIPPDKFTSRNFLENIALETHALKLAVVGRTNTGKSTLTNTLIGEKRSIVSEIPGTTRDTIDVLFLMSLPNGASIPVKLIDTAGLKKTSKISEAVDKFSMIRTENAIKQADIILFMLDLSTGITSYDKHISNLVNKTGKGVLILPNKYDIYIKDFSDSMQRLHKSVNYIVKDVKTAFPALNYAQVLPVSAKTGFNLDKLPLYIDEIMEQRNIRITTSLFNKILARIVEKHHPPTKRNKTFKIYYGTMTGSSPPEFTLFVNDRSLCTQNYINYIVNSIRNYFAFTGYPIILKLKNRPKPKRERSKERVESNK